MFLPPEAPTRRGLHGRTKQLKRRSQRAQIGVVGLADGTNVGTELFPTASDAGATQGDQH